MEDWDTQQFEPIESLPDEVLATIFGFARFPIALCLVSHRWKKVYFMSFCYYEESLDFLDRYKSLVARANKALDGITNLLISHNRNPKSIFARPSLAGDAFFAAMYHDKLELVRR
eukprot:TRINITY_DN6576_c0_g1_i4.p1 TRINITY_DN6576_c0_g1~~TRINITY_DN6576_c0_g1_i4.p1  ORF type:complete len:115 (+),score=5.12 TRINITY_DN6576_c0_g1_i4:118-462(+)